jgi:hypothetical protein
MGPVDLHVSGTSTLDGKIMVSDPDSLEKVDLVQLVFGLCKEIELLRNEIKYMPYDSCTGYRDAKESFEDSAGQLDGLD